jgi:hypothetical protein
MRKLGGLYHCYDLAAGATANISYRSQRIPTAVGIFIAETHLLYLPIAGS